MARKKEPTSWHTKKERKLIRKYGGKPLIQYGYDGYLSCGSPVEVRCARKDNRFRIQKDVHRTLVRKGGYYIFHASGKGHKKLPAKEVSRRMGRGKWYKDRSYPHRFITTKQVFGGN